MSRLINLGYRGYHAIVQEFEGMIRVHIRKYSYTDGRICPTKFGAALSIDEFKDLQSVVEQLNEMVDYLIDTDSILVLPNNNRKLPTLLKLGSRGYHATVKELNATVKIHK